MKNLKFKNGKIIPPKEGIAVDTLCLNEIETMDSVAIDFYYHAQAGRYQRIAAGKDGQDSFCCHGLREPRRAGDEKADRKAQRIFTEPKIKAMWAALVKQLEHKEAPLRILTLLEEQMTPSQLR